MHNNLFAILWTVLFAVLFALITTVVFVPSLPGQALAQDPSDNPETALKEAQARLDQIGAAEDDVGRAWHAAVSARVRFLQQLQATRGVTLPTSEEIARRKQAAQAVTGWPIRNHLIR